MSLQFKPVTNARRRQAIAFDQIGTQLLPNVESSFDVFAQQFEGLTLKYNEYRKQIDYLQEKDKRSRSFLKINKMNYLITMSQEEFK